MLPLPATIRQSEQYVRAQHCVNPPEKIRQPLSFDYSKARDDGSETTTSHDDNLFLPNQEQQQRLPLLLI